MKIRVWLTPEGQVKLSGEGKTVSTDKVYGLSYWDIDSPLHEALLALDPKFVVHITARLEDARLLKPGLTEPVAGSQIMVLHRQHSVTTNNDMFCAYGYHSEIEIKCSNVEVLTETLKHLGDIIVVGQYDGSGGTWTDDDGDEDL